MPLPAGAVLFGQMLAAAFACGFNLYATIAIIGLGSRLGWFGGLPPGLRGLENGIVIGSAIVLFLVEAVVDKTRWADTLWDAVHTFIRPLAAGLLGGLALAGTSGPLPVLGALAAAAAALAAHATKAGLRVALNARPAPTAAVLASLLEDGAAVGLALAAMLAPLTAAAASVALALGLGLFGRRYWRAAAFGARAAIARLRGFFGGAGWRDARRLPPPLRPLARIDPPEYATVHTVRAAVLGLAGAGAYRNGWLVFERDVTAFLFLRRLRPSRIELPPIREPRITPGVLAHTVSAQTDAGPLRLFLLKDGPAPETAVAELSATARNTGPPRP